MKTILSILAIFFSTICIANSQQCQLHLQFNNGQVPQYVYITIDGQPYFSKTNTDGKTSLNLNIDYKPKAPAIGSVITTYYSYGHLFYSNRPNLTPQLIRTLKPNKIDFVIEPLVKIDANRKVNGKLNNSFQPFAHINNYYDGLNRSYTQKYKSFRAEYYYILERKENAYVKQVLNTTNDSLAYDALTAIPPKGLSDKNYNAITTRFSTKFKTDAKTAYVFKQLDKYKTNKHNLSTLTFVNTAGKEITYSSAVSEYTLIDFWATWCAPCVEELPDMIALGNQWKGKGLNVVFVSLDTNRDKWLNFINKSKPKTENTYILPNGFNNALAKSLNISAIPSNVLIDKAGNIVAAKIHREELIKKLDELLVKHETSK